jgi:hypothetical protein
LGLSWNQINDISTILDWTVLPTSLNVKGNPVYCAQSELLDVRDDFTTDLYNYSATPSCIDP